MEFEFTDRYKATGTPYPDENSCDECEGMGLHPAKAEELNNLACSTPDGTITIIGQKEKDGSPMPYDGWLFVRCFACNGTRLATPNSRSTKNGE